MIELVEVNKNFGKQSIIKSVTYSFEKGKMYGLCGRNGSGKTILLKLIAGFLRPDSGNIKINGKEIGRDCDFAEKTGILIEQPGFLKTKSGYYNLKCLADIRKEIGDEEIRWAMGAVGLDWKEKKWVGKYSMGMRQRLGIAQAIMENPDVLLLDEPLNGLDTSGAEELRELFKRFRDDGKLIILASHLREDLDGLCDHILRISEGRIMCDGEVSGIR